MHATATTLALVECIYLDGGMSLHIFLCMHNLSKLCMVMEQKLSKANQDPNPFNKIRLLPSLSASKKENERLYVPNSQQC